MKTSRTLLTAVLLATAVACGGGNGDAPAEDATDSGGASLAGFDLGKIADTVSGMTLGAEHGVLFYAFDTLAYPEQPVDLVARLQSGKNLKDLPGARVGFYRGEELIGAADTDEDGYARISWTPPAGGNHALTARVLEGPDDEGYADAVNATAVPLLVAARPRDTRFVVVDLDHTVVDDSFMKVIVTSPKPMAGAADALKRIEEEYSIIYLTHRPDILARKSKAWLSDNGFPDAPLLVSELKDAVGDSGKFKTAKLKAVREAYPNVAIGIGDKLSDAQAYVDNGLTAYLIPDYDREKAKEVEKMAGDIDDLDGHGRLHVVDTWAEIEEGVFSDRKFTPESYVSKLKALAARLKEEEKREDEEDD